MLQNIRDRFTGGFAIAILALLCVPFVFFGINYDFTGTAAAAKVNGEEISVNEFDQAYRQQLANYGNFGADLPQELRAILRDNVLQNLVWDTVVDQYVTDANYRISNEMIMGFIRTAEEFQVDGEFSKDSYYGWLAERGIDPVIFEANQRVRLRQGQLQRGVGATAFVTPAEYRRFLNLVREERDVSIATFDLQSFADAVEVSDEDVQAYYDARPDAYLAPESVDFKYVELRRDALADQVEITEDELQEYYEQSGDRFLQDEQRQARHILIEFGDDEGEAEALANTVAEQAKAGDSFADLASQYSADSGTAGQGGDLGFLTQSQLPGALGDAIFSMREGEITGPVRSDFGYHVVQLDNVRSGGPLPLAQVRGELLEELRTRAADRVWNEKERELSDALFDADNIETIAANLGLTLQNATGFTRQGGAPFGNNQAIIDAAFDDVTLEDRRITDIIELDANRSVALQVTAYQEAQRMPLADVRDSIVETIRNERARAAISVKTTELRDAVESGEDFAAAAEAVGASGVSSAVMTRDDAEADANIRAAVFQVKKPVDGKARIGVVQTSSGDEAVFAVTGYRPGRPESIPVDQRDAGKLQLAAQAGQADYAALVFELERQADIVRNVDALEQQSLYQ